MKASFIAIFVSTVLCAATVGCDYSKSARPVKALPAEGTDSKTLPAAPEASSPGDIIPSAPAAEPTPTTPDPSPVPAAPAPVVEEPKPSKPEEPKTPAEAPKSEDPTKPSEGDKPVEKTPDPKNPVIIIAHPIQPVPIVTYLIPKKMKSVQTLAPTIVPCENCTGPDGGSISLDCPAGYGVTGYEIGEGEFVVGTEGGGFLSAEREVEITTPIIGGLKLVCSRITPLNVDPDQTAFAAVFPEGTNQAGITPTGDVIDGCDKYAGLATGIFGRNGGRLDSFGLFCGAYSPSETGVYVYSKAPGKKHTTSSPDVPYGGAPGLGGSPFAVQCGENEVMTGLQVRGGDELAGVESIDCSALEPVF